MKVTKELLRRYGLGICTEEEKKTVEEWLDAPEYPSIRVSTDEKSKANSDEIWSKLSEGRPRLENQMSLKKAKFVILLGKVARYAAVAAILFTVGFFSYLSLQGNFEVDRTQPLAALKTINTQRGEKRTVTLSDGSTIRMNYETEIRVREKFEGNERVVYLTGHAHFNVTRDTERPFIVYTEDSKTQVLGTSFDIDTREEGETEIIVTSGKVAFSGKEKAGKLVTLEVNDRAVLDAGKNIAKSEVDADRLTAWRENRMVFDDQMLKEIIEVLEPWYDIQVSVEDADLMTRDFKLSMDNPTLESVMEALSFLGEFDYRIHEKTVTIY